MTAEICVMNTYGVALAADSAVTVDRGAKIYNSANKLFALSKYHPIGIMIYGNASYMAMPWETIIKVYRNQLGKDKFDLVNEYGEDFLTFLMNNEYEELTSKKMEDKYTLTIMSIETSDLFKFILNKIKEKVNENPDVKEDELFNYGDSILELILSKLDSEPFIGSFNEDDLRFLLEEFGEELEKTVLQTFENFIFSESMVTSVKYIVASSLLKRFSSVSGIVIAGFGEKELYPNLISYEIEGRFNGKLKYQIKESEKIGYSSSATIIPFAQDDMVHTFIRGIAPDIEELSNGYLKELFENIPNVIIEQLQSDLGNENSELVKNSLVNALKTVYDDYKGVLNDYKQENFTIPTLNIVNSLPKEELAEMAEALVNLTSFKRKVSSSIESVGGPVDVAVITKGDGFVWIKRKHYFDAGINNQFHQKYFWRDTNAPIITREES
jgi:hypothetical protein